MQLVQNFKKSKNWIYKTRRKFSRFFYALIVSYIVLALTIYLQAPLNVVLIVLISTLVIPFTIVLKILTENLIYLTLRKSVWGNAVITVVITIYGSLAYIWASGEVNKIFLEAPGDFYWTISILTVIHFFKNIVVAIVGAYLAFLILYVNFWVLDILIFTYKDLQHLVKRVLSGVLLIFSLGLVLGSSGFLTKESDKFAALIAVKADFNQHHRCQGDNFSNIDGVMFLPQGYVLIAKPSKHGVWDFEKVKCTT